MQLLTLALTTIAASAAAVKGAALPTAPVVPDGRYQIINVFLGTAMTKSSGPVYGGSQIVLSPYTGSRTQQWYVQTLYNLGTSLLSMDDASLSYASTVQTTSGQAPGYETLQTLDGPTHFTLTSATPNSTIITTPDGSVLDFYHYDALNSPAIPVIVDAPGQVGEAWYFISVL